MVTDALEAARHEDQIDTRLDRLWIPKHEGQQLPYDLIFQCVQPIVLPEHGVRRPHVFRNECVEGLTEHLERQLTHARQIDQGFDRRMQKISLRGLAEIDDEVSDTLQIVVDLERRHDRSEIDCDRLV
jgi:hypothetical protein